MTSHTASARSRRWAAAALALILGLTGSLAATQSASAVDTPQVTVSPSTEIDATVANSFVVSGSGFSGDSAVNGVYVLLGPASNWVPGTAAPGAGWTTQAWVQPAQLTEGTFTTTLDVAAGALDPTVEYVVATSAAHGLSQTDRSLDTFSPLSFAVEAQPEPQPEPEPEPQPEPAYGFTVSPTTGLTSGDSVTITGTYPATVGGRATSLYGMYCVDPGSSRATGAQCDSSRQLALSSVSQFGGQIRAIGTVADGVWTFEATMTVGDAIGSQSCLVDGTYQCGVFLRLDHNFPNNVDFDEFAPVTFAAAAPAVVVSKTADLSPAGEVITVTGTGFLPNAPATTGTRPPLSGKFGGAYVVFGKFQDNWKPSTGAPSSTRKIGSQQWVMNPADAATIGSGAVAINPDGSFSVQLTVSKGFGELTTGNYGIYTYSGSGAAYAAFETFTPVTFSTAPVVSVSKTAGLNPLGEAITVKGWNFTPNAPATTGTRPPLSGKFGGAYVVFGKFQDAWKPSAAAPSGNRKIGAQVWAMDAADSASIGTGTIALAADGSFTTTLDVKRDFTGEPATGNYGVYTYSGSGAAYAAFETFTPLAFTAATATTTTLAATAAVEDGTSSLTATVAPNAPGTITFRQGETVIGTAPSTAPTIVTGALAAGSHTFTAEFVPTNALLFAPSTGTVTLTVAPKQVAAGSLTWGVKQSFRDYVSGSIARGTITTSGVGTVGGQFVFGQSTGGTFTQRSGTGTASYSGSVRFYGHDGLLDVTFSNPVIDVESASRATLYVTVGGRSVAIASLNLAAATKSSPGNTVAYSGVPATLTSQGTAVFSLDGSPFYSVGTALDPVNFVIGTPGNTTTGTTTIAAFAAPREPAATPPATTGITVEAQSLKNLVAGGEVTITMSGFEPNETGIMIVIYSDPVVLARDLTADADGNLTWTGRLPASLAGTHTLTAQGSVDRGVVLNIPAKAARAAEGCSVDGATITWGFKESFRSYISGSIANGQWTVADGATYETPNFGWSGGTGAYAAEGGLVSFAGSVTFTGHQGVLNTTVSNPQVQFVDENTAVMLVDISGTTQDGTAVDQKAVEFVTIELGGAITQADGSVTVTDAATTLTAAGAAAFGTYPEGEAFDPISFTLPTTGCETAVAPTNEVTAISGEPTSAAADLTWLWILVAAVVLLAIAVVVAIVVRRRRTV